MADGIGRKVGVLGGGQLGRMMGFAAGRLGIELVILDPLGAASPGGQVTQGAVAGSFQDADKVRELASKCDVITAEIEHVNCDVLEELEAAGKIVRPSSKVIRTIQDKQLQKEVLSKHGVPVVEWRTVEATKESVASAVVELGGFPAMLKSRKQAYDGRGNYVLNSEADIVPAVETLSKNVGGLYLERWSPFVAEIAVMVARSAANDNETVAYDVVETRQRDNICHFVVSPPSFKLSDAARAKAQEIALQSVSAIDGIGIFGVEMFLLDNDDVVLNEMAPRPHNSGHLTIEACVTDQFEQHLRAVLGMRLGDPSMCVAASAMVNVLGAETHEQTMDILRAADGKPGVALHWYGKAGGNRLGRKLGHMTVTADSMPELRVRLAAIGQPLDVAGGKAAAASVHVGVIMGSDSDLPCMTAACKVLEQFNVPFECTVVSAHRTPTRMYEYAQSAKSRGLKCIIAGAGGAAHLPGMVAALTPLPVIGVPVKSSALSGNDSLLSIVQMPRGVPVATVAIGNAMNAGLLAVRMLAAFDSRLAADLDAWHAEQESSVEKKAEHMEELGHAKYLEEYTK